MCPFSSDQKTIDGEISSLRDGLKPKVSRLHQLEGLSAAEDARLCMYQCVCVFAPGRAQVKGFDLKGMNTEELRTISK